MLSDARERLLRQPAQGAFSNVACLSRIHVVITMGKVDYYISIHDIRRVFEHQINEQVGIVPACSPNSELIFTTLRIPWPASRG